MFESKLAWQWALLTMIGYTALIHLLGFVLASVVYVPVSILMSGGQNVRRALVIGLTVAVGVYFFARIVHLQLPPGALELLR